MAANNSERWFSKIASDTANNSGRPWAFGIASLFVVGWLITGPARRDRRPRDTPIWKLEAALKCRS